MAPWELLKPPDDRTATEPRILCIEIHTMSNRIQDHQRLTGVILAGGAGTRFGGPKATMQLHGSPLLERTVATLSRITDEVAIVGHPYPLEFKPPVHVTMVPDRIAQRGPLAALTSVLGAIPPGLVAVVGCDMPFADSELLEHQASLATGFDAVVPIADGRLQPLHAIYHTSISPTLERLVEEGESSMQSLVSEIATRFLEAEEWSRFSPDGRCFFNINTPADYEFAAAILSQSPFSQTT